MKVFYLPSEFCIFGWVPKVANVAISVCTSVAPLQTLSAMPKRWQNAKKSLLYKKIKSERNKPKPTARQSQNNQEAPHKQERTTTVIIKVTKIQTNQTTHQPTNQPAEKPNNHPSGIERRGVNAHWLGNALHGPDLNDFGKKA